jgi:hypothetical protein
VLVLKKNNKKNNILIFYQLRNIIHHVIKHSLPKVLIKLHIKICDQELRLKARSLKHVPYDNYIIECTPPMQENTYNIKGYWTRKWKHTYIFVTSPWNDRASNQPLLL